MSIRYRPEIDGLRTVAVVSVLIYHLKIKIAGWNVLSGGFLGVDVFFVISGFLIASLIHNELGRTGGFSILNFYERRARRLLPALFVVVFASALVGWFILLPSAMMEFSQSSLASIGFVSNIYWFFASQEYGARSGLLQPLLHTWSLAVEEQFYLVFPGFFVLALRWFPCRFTAVGIGIVLVGLVLAEVLTRLDFAFSFYWLFSRIWELMAGVVLAHVMVTKPSLLQKLSFAHLLPKLGLVLILGSILLMHLDRHHPGIGTLGAVAGAVMIIGFASPDELVTRLLSTKLFTGIGLISYSLYLWHYPVFAFGRMLNPELGPLDVIAWFTLSFLLAYLSWRFVEHPFRNRSAVTLPRLVAAGVLATLALIAFSTTMLASNGLRTRLPGMITLYGPNEFDNAILQESSWNPLNSLAAKHGFGPSAPHEASEFERTQLWFDKDPRTRNILLIGNSHSKDMFNALYFAKDQLTDWSVARYGMANKGFDAQLSDLLAAPNFKAADLIAVSFRYNDQTLNELSFLIRRLKSAGKSVALFSNSVEFRSYRAQPLFDGYLLQHHTLDIKAMNTWAWKMQLSSKINPINAEIHRIATVEGVPALDKQDFICDFEIQSCDVVTPEGTKVFFDYGHYTLAGAAHFGRRIAAMNWLAPLGSTNMH